MNDYVLNKKPEPAANEMVWGSARVPRAGDTPHSGGLGVRAARPNRWLNHLIWETDFRRDAENGGRDGRAPHESGIATRRRRI